MQTNLTNAITFVLAREGLWNAREVTMRGVTQATYNGFRASNGLPAQSVRKISDQELFDIYDVGYFRSIRFAELPSGLDLAVADCSINSGPHEAICLLQRALNIKVDGIFGYQTLAAVNQCDVPNTIDRYCDSRLSFMHRLRNWKLNASGWATRVALVRKTALKLAGAPPADPQTETTMSNTALFNWRTTLGGLAYLVVSQGPAFLHITVDPTMQQWALSVIVMMIGVTAKDGAVTGLPPK